MRLKKEHRKSRKERYAGIMGIEILGIKAHTPAVFGCEEKLGLEVDPNKKLRKMELLLF